MLKKYNLVEFNLADVQKIKLGVSRNFSSAEISADFLVKAEISLFGFSASNFGLKNEFHKNYKTKKKSQ